METGTLINDILPAIERWLADGQKVAVATVVKVEGTAPRREGAKLVVAENGEMAGSVSGGCVEGAVLEEALRVLKTGRATRMDSGPRRAGSAGFAEGPTSVDLSKSAVASVWRYRDSEFNSFDTDLRVRTLKGRRPVSVAGAANTEDCDYETVLSPTLSGSSLLYLDTTGNDWVLGRTPATHRAPRFANESTGDAERVPTSAAVDGSRLVVSETKTTIGGRADGETQVLQMPLGTFSSKTTVGC